MVCNAVSAVRMLREELQQLQEPGSYVGEVVKVMSKTKVLCKVHPEGKYVVDLDKVCPQPTCGADHATTTTCPHLRSCDARVLHVLSRAAG